MYETLATKAQNDLLGPLYLRGLSNNLGWLRWMAGAEHIISSGEHNAWEVPRVCRRISGTTVSPASSDITAVANGTVGTYTLTLAAARFSTDMRVQINVAGDATKPHRAAWKYTSATSIDVYIKKMTSALGVAGNTWAAANSDFDIAIHSTPLSPGSWNTLPALWARGDYFDHRSTGWNTLVQENAEIQRVLTAAHTSAGVHNVREVGKYAGRVMYDGAGYRVAGGLSSASRTSAGVVVVTHASVTTPVNAFIAPDFSRYNGGSSSDRYVMNAVQTSATQTTVYIYRWNSSSGWWEVNDADFFVTFHGD